MTGDALAGRLRDIVGSQHVLTDADLKAGYETDWTGRFQGKARLVVRPSRTNEVAAVLVACAEAGVPVVPQGGNTGLVGGSVPSGGEVVLSVRRLDEIGEVDAVAGQVTAGAGVTLATLQAHARAARLDFGVDIPARDSATIGGMVATNAGGIHVMRFGHMRQQVAGIEAVLADGSIVSRLSGLQKDNSGYDLAGLLAGSEGTLAVITKVRLRLVPQRPHRVVALLALGDTAAAQDTLTALRPGLPSLEAAEIFYREGVELVCEHSGLLPPFAEPYPCYLLLECAGRMDPATELIEALETSPPGPLSASREGGTPRRPADASPILDTAVATDRPGRERLWAYRELHTSAINAAGIPHKLDVSLPPGELAAFERDVRALVAGAAPGARVILFGHLGDGNLHVNILGVPPEDETVDDLVLRMVAERGGSISAEHGIGRAKLRWLSLTRSEADIAAMRAIKQAVDPSGILNPGVLLNTAMDCGR
ncbi:MAG: FAD-binding protein [Dehalococcoidia bacterium]|nr:FAD-binding protein [Dehalococcoidia bacterium]